MFTVTINCKNTLDFGIQLQVMGLCCESSTEKTDPDNPKTLSVKLFTIILI